MIGYRRDQAKLLTNSLYPSDGIGDGVFPWRGRLARLDFLNLALDELSSSVQCALELRNLTVGPIDPAIQTRLDSFCCVRDDIVDGVPQLNLSCLHFVPGLLGEVT